MTAPTEMFMTTKGERHPTEKAMLCGVRLLTVTETEEGRHWNKSLIKKLTGRDTITGRFMRQDFFRFSPTHKLMISGNHRPAIRTVDVAISRRMNVIPFTVTIPKREQDK